MEQNKRIYSNLYLFKIKDYALIYIIISEN